MSGPAQLVTGRLDLTEDNMLFVIARTVKGEIVVLTSINGKLTPVSSSSSAAEALKVALPVLAGVANAVKSEESTIAIARVGLVPGGSGHA